MKKILINILIFCLCLMSMLSLANALSSNINSIDESVIINVPKNVSIELTNNKNYNIYNIDINSKYIKIPISNLSISESRRVNLTILTNLSGNLNEQAIIRSYQIKSCQELGQKTYEINVTSTGLNLNNINICPGDIIKFNNQYSPYIKVTIFNTNVLDDRIDVNNSKVYTAFSNVGNYHFSVYPLIGDGNIIVTQTNIYTHDSLDDINLSINLNSIYDATAVTANLNKNNFTMNYDDVESNYVVIQNTGNKKAYNITLSGEWFIGFTSNNFDLNIGESKAVNFQVSPYILDTSSTNKSYTKQLSIKGNFDTILKNINIFINYSDLNTGDVADWWQDRLRFCNAYPTSPYCITEPLIKTMEVPKYACPPILAELSPEDVRDILQSIVRVEDGFMTLDNYLKIKWNELTLNMSSIQNLTQTTLDNSISSKEQSKFSTRLFLTLIIVAIFLAIAAILMYLIYKIRRKKAFLEGEFS